MAISLTEPAAERVRTYLDARGKGVGLRVGVKKTGCNGFAYVINYADEVLDGDIVFEERGVKVVGTDAWSWDAPFNHTAKRWLKDRDPSIVWEGHKAGRELPYWQMEKLGNLESLPDFGFTVSCFPVKIKAASAGWTRCVALLQE